MEAGNGGSGHISLQWAIWVSIGSHVLMIMLVSVCTAWFWLANRRAKEGKGLIEDVPNFRYTY
jgi:hypothetical protein